MINKNIMKKSINVKDFMQMMPAITSEFSNASKGDDEMIVSNRYDHQFLSNIKPKIKKRKINTYEQERPSAILRKEYSRMQSRKKSQFHDRIQMNLQDKFKTLEIKRAKEKRTYKTAKIQQYQFSVSNDFQKSINPQQLHSLKNDKNLNPYQQFLRKKQMLKLKIKFNKLSLSTETIKQELKSPRFREKKPSTDRRISPQNKMTQSIVLAPCQTTKFKSRMISFRKSMNSKNITQIL